MFSNKIYVTSKIDYNLKIEFEIFTFTIDF